jgi:hypothetical protein
MLIASLRILALVDRPQGLVSVHRARPTQQCGSQRRLEGDLFERDETLCLPTFGTIGLSLREGLREARFRQNTAKRN